MCVDVVLVCKTQVPAAGSSQSATIGAGTIRNDGSSHPVSVFATDVAGNQSPLLTLPGGLLMPIPATPVISLVGGNGNGCAPLVAAASSSDSGTPGPTFHLLVDGVAADFGSVITGDPFKTVTLLANATFGSDISAMSAPVTAQIYDPDGPPDAPLVHGQADPSSSSETLSWAPVTATGAPIIGYQVTVPGVLEGIFVEQSDNPTLKVTGLQESQNYVAQVTAVDGCKRQSPLADSPPVFRIDDASPPTAPGLAVPTTGGHDVQLSWTPSTDNVAVDDYKVFRNGTQIARTNKTSYDDTGLADALSSDYTVVATDTAGNQSASSVTRTATTKDVTAPSLPGLVSRRAVGRNGRAALGCRDGQRRRHGVPGDPRRRTGGQRHERRDLHGQERGGRDPPLRRARVRRGGERVGAAGHRCGRLRRPQGDGRLRPSRREGEGREGRDGRRRCLRCTHRAVVHPPAGLRPRRPPPADRQEHHREGEEGRTRSSRARCASRCPRARAERPRASSLGERSGEEGRHHDPARQAARGSAPSRRHRDERHGDPRRYRRRLEGADDRRPVRPSDLDTRRRA